jgi:hypothetical protein
MLCTEHDYEFITESPTSMAKRFDTISSDREETVVEVNTKRSRKRRPVGIDDEEEVEVLVAPPKKRKQKGSGKQANVKPTKKVKSKTDVFQDDEDEEPSKTISIHLFIESIASAPKSRSKSALSSAVKTLQRGQNLVVSKMQWKFETPLGGLRKLLANDTGYDAMVSAAKTKKGDVAVFVYMPPPVKAEEVRLIIDAIIVTANG